MAERDKYDKDILKALQKIGKHLESIDILSSEDKALLIVGKKKPNKPIEIINAFEGEDAIRLYRKLITKKKLEG